MENYKLLLSTTILFCNIAIFSDALHAAQKRGDNEFQASGAFFHAQGADSGTIAADVSYGKFMTKHWEVGIRQGFSYSFLDKSNDVWIATTIPFINYHLLDFSRDGSFQPFVGAFIGASWNENDATGTMGPNAGFKHYIGKQTFLVIRYRYEWFFSNFDVGDAAGNESDGNHVGTIGLGYVWGGSR